MNSWHFIELLFHNSSMMLLFHLSLGVFKKLYGMVTIFIYSSINCLFLNVSISVTLYNICFNTNFVGLCVLFHFLLFYVDIVYIVQFNSIFCFLTLCNAYLVCRVRASELKYERFGLNRIRLYDSVILRTRWHQSSLA